MRQLSLFKPTPDFADNLLASILKLPKKIHLAMGVLALIGLAVGLIIKPELVVLAIAGIGLGIPAIFFVWNRPELVLVGVIFLSSGFIAARKMEIGGGLELRDAAFLGVLGLLAFQAIIRKKLSFPWWPVSAPLLLFLILAMVSLIDALFFRNVAQNWALNDMRILIYYGMFFSTAWAIREEKQLTIIWLGLFAIADLIALIILLQQPLGASNPLLESMVGSRWDLHSQGSLVRVVPAAHALMHFMAVIAFTFIIFERHNKKMFWFGILQFLYLNISLLLTFTRSQWLATAIAIFLISLILVPENKDVILQWLAKYALPTILVLIAVIGVAGSLLLESLATIPIIGSVVERAATIFTPEETLETNSLEWREFEFEKGFEAIRNNPFFGVSLGNAYREVTTLQGEVLGWWTDGSLEMGTVSRFTRFIHSSYLAIAVKMGLFGFIAFMWFCLAFLIKGWQLYRNLPQGRNKGLVLGIITSFIGLMQWSIFHTHFMRTESTIAVGIMSGIVAGIYQMYRNVGFKGKRNGNEAEQTYINVSGK